MDRPIGDFNFDISNHDRLNQEFLHILLGNGYCPGFSNIIRPSDKTCNWGTCIDNIFIKLDKIVLRPKYKVRAWYLTSLIFARSQLKSVRGDFPPSYFKRIGTRKQNDWKAKKRSLSISDAAPVLSKHCLLIYESTARAKDAFLSISRKYYLCHTHAP